MNLTHLVNRFFFSAQPVRRYVYFLMCSLFNMNFSPKRKRRLHTFEQDAWGEANHSQILAKKIVCLNFYQFFFAKVETYGS